MMTRTRGPRRCAVLLLALMALLWLGGTAQEDVRRGPAAAGPFPRAGTAGSREAARARLQAAYGRLPLHLEANQGQTAPEVAFLARGLGYGLFLTPTEGKGAVLRLKLVGAAPDTQPTGERALAGTSNYFLGNDPTRWRTNVPTYAKVRYHNIYPGIDLVYYGTQHQLEHDFIVTPGADPAAIRFQVEGAERLEAKHLAEARSLMWIVEKLNRTDRYGLLGTTAQCEVGSECRGLS